MLMTTTALAKAASHMNLVYDEIVKQLLNYFKIRLRWNGEGLPKFISCFKKYIPISNSKFQNYIWPLKINFPILSSKSRMEINSNFQLLKYRGPKFNIPDSLSTISSYTVLGPAQRQWKQHEAFGHPHASNENGHEDRFDYRYYSKNRSTAWIMAMN